MAEKSKLAGKPRSVLSWLKPCEKEGTLETLKNLNVDELNQVVSIADMVKAKAIETIEAQAEIELAKKKEELEAIQKQIAELEKAVAEKKK